MRFSSRLKGRFAKTGAVLTLVSLGLSGLAGFSSPQTAWAAESDPDSGRVDVASETFESTVETTLPAATESNDTGADSTGAVSDPVSEEPGGTTATIPDSTEEPSPEGPQITQVEVDQTQNLQITDRISGKNRYETMFKVSSRLPKNADQLFLVSGKSQVDGVTCGTINAPVLYVDHFQTETGFQNIRNQIDTLAPKKLVLLGGSGILTDQEFSRISEGYPSQRIAGSNRIETAVNFSRYAFPDSARRVYLVNQGSEKEVSPDAAPAASLEGGPILLSAAAGLTDQALEEIKRLSPDEVVIIGGTGVLSGNIENQLKTSTTVPLVSRWSGNNRQETALAVANHREGENQHILVARADRPVDAVAAGALNVGPLLYLPVNTALQDKNLINLANSLQVWSVIPIGGVAGRGFVFFDAEALEPPAHVEIPVPYISQIWPYSAWVGCEPTALLMGLQGKGYAQGVTLKSFLDAMPKSATNPALGFAGSPYVPSERLRTTIYPTALSNYGKRFGDVRDMTGASMDQVINTVRHGHPVVVYLTLYYRPAYYRWFNIDGQQQLLLRNNHAVLLNGYDVNTQQFLVADPYNKDGQNPFIYWKPRSVIEPLYNLRHHALAVF